MGTWISHLRIADLLLNAIPGLDEVSFIFGNLAPDSGLPNADWTEFDPPKEVTHFLVRGQLESAIHDLRFFRGYLSIEPGNDIKKHSFRLGYHCHLFCDLLWARRIGSTTQRVFAGEIAAGAAGAWDRIKDDWYGLDHLYLRSHPENAFFRVILTEPDPPSHLPFLRMDALHQQLEHIRRFYGDPQPEWLVPRPFPYMNELTMNRIVMDSVEAVLELYRLLRETGGSALHDSSADILPGSYFSPYPPPLGDQ